jgi:hypothetical protein
MAPVFGQVLNHLVYDTPVDCLIFSYRSDFFINVSLLIVCVESTAKCDMDGDESACDTSAKKALLSRVDAVDNPEYYGQSADEPQETWPCISDLQKRD